MTRREWRGIAVAVLVGMIAAVVASVVLASKVSAHVGRLEALCDRASLTAASYPAGTIMALTVDGVSVAGSPLTLAAPTYANAQPQLSTTYPGTGHTITGTITSSDHERDFAQTLEVIPCPSPQPSESVSSSSVPPPRYSDTVAVAELVFDTFAQRDAVALADSIVDGIKNADTAHLVDIADALLHRVIDPNVRFSRPVKLTADTLWELLRAEPPQDGSG